MNRKDQGHSAASAPPPHVIVSRCLVAGSLRSSASFLLVKKQHREQRLNQRCGFLSQRRGKMWCSCSGPCLLLLLQRCHCHRAHRENSSLKQTNKHSWQSSDFPSVSSSVGVAAEETPDMNSFHAEMKLLMSSICYCQRAARAAAAA